MEQLTQGRDDLLIVPFFLEEGKRQDARFYFGIRRILLIQDKWGMRKHAPPLKKSVGIRDVLLKTACICGFSFCRLLNQKTLTEDILNLAKKTHDL